MIITEVPSGHVPVEVFGLKIERERVGEQLTQGGCDLHNAFAAEIRRYLLHGMVPFLGLSYGFLLHLLFLLFFLIQANHP